MLIQQNRTLSNFLKTAGCLRLGPADERRTHTHNGRRAKCFFFFHSDKNFPSTFADATQNSRMQCKWSNYSQRAQTDVQFTSTLRVKDIFFESKTKLSPATLSISRSRLSLLETYWPSVFPVYLPMKGSKMLTLYALTLPYLHWPIEERSHYQQISCNSIKVPICV